MSKRVYRGHCSHEKFFEIEYNEDCRNCEFYEVCVRRERRRQRKIRRQRMRLLKLGLLAVGMIFIVMALVLSVKMIVKAWSNSSSSGNEFVAESMSAEAKASEAPAYYGPSEPVQVFVEVEVEINSGSDEVVHEEAPEENTDEVEPSIETLEVKTVENVVEAEATEDVVEAEVTESVVEAEATESVVEAEVTESVVEAEATENVVEAVQLSQEKDETETQVVVTISAYGPSEYYYYNLSYEEKVYIAKVVYAESRGEPFEGKVAVAAVILNRYVSNDRRFNRDSIYSVVTQSGQFASIKNVSMSDLESIPSCLEAVEAACKGYDPSRVKFENGALFFYNPDGNLSQDARNAREGIETYRIGSHLFHVSLNF